MEPPDRPLPRAVRLLFAGPDAPGAPSGRLAEYAAMGRALSPCADVHLAVPGGVPVVAPELPTSAWRTERDLRRLMRGADITVIPAQLLRRFPRLSRACRRLVIDLDRAEPDLVLGPVFARLAVEGHLFICDTAAERDRWRPILIAARRHDPRRVPPDPDHRLLVEAVPRGTDAAEWDRSVDPVRLYCSRTRHDRAVAPRQSVGGHNGSVATTTLADLARVSSVDDLRQRLAASGVLDIGQRFLFLEVDVTNKCNLRCTMCHFSFDRHFHAPPVQLRAEDFTHLADAILPHAQALMLSVGSEPLMSPHFTSILRQAARYGVPEIGFYTNAQLMTDRVVDAVLEGGVTLVVVSVDGARKETYESIRRGAKFEALVGNVRRLALRRSAAGRALPRIRFGVVLMRRNADEWADIVDLGWRLGVEEMSFFHVAVYDGLGMEGESLVHDKARANACLTAAHARADELGLRVVHRPNLFALETEAAAPAHPPEPFARRPYCLFPFFHITADAGLQIMPCPFSHGEAPYGCVSARTPFADVWFGERFVELRRRILTNDPPPMCRRCSYLASSHPDLADLFAPRAIG